MLERLFTAAGSVLLIAILAFGPDFASYLATTTDVVGASIREQIPVEFEIKRARKMISDLAPEIKDNRYAIAREEIEIERLGERIQTLRRNQKVARTQLIQLQSQLQTGNGVIQTVSTRPATTIHMSADVAQTAELKLKQYRLQEQTLASLENSFATREKALHTARLQLEQMASAKRQLQTEVESLEARQKMARVAEDSAQLAFDDSHLERTRELIHQIETRVRIEERLAEPASAVFVAGQKQRSETPNEIAQKITRYFEERGASKETAGTTVADADTFD